MRNPTNGIIIRRLLVNCPNCNALYQIVKIEAGPKAIDRRVTCRACGGPLPARERKVRPQIFSVAEGDSQQNDSQQDNGSVRPAPLRPLSASRIPAKLSEAFYNALSFYSVWWPPLAGTNCTRRRHALFDERSVRIRG
jgi:hypothetical protein